MAVQVLSEDIQPGQSQLLVEDQIYHLPNNKPLNPLTLADLEGDPEPIYTAMKPFLPPMKNLDTPPNQTEELKAKLEKKEKALLLLMDIMALQAHRRRQKKKRRRLMMFLFLCLILLVMLLIVIRLAGLF